MRLRSYKWLLAVGLLVAGYKVYQSQSDLHQWLRRHQFRVDGISQALPSQVYSLESNRWLTFDIPNDTPLIRLISNASVRRTEKATQGTQWPYAIEYQLRGNQGQVIRNGTYHFKGEQLVFLDKGSGQPVEVNTYLERWLSPLGGRRFFLNLKDPGLRGAEFLAVRLQSKHPSLLDVAVRVYFQAQNPDRKIGYLWNRLSEDQQRDLARGNVYSIEGLTEQEKHGLLRYHWSVAAPDGIPGRDFESRILYIRDDSEDLEMLKDWAPSGIVLDAKHRGVLPLTNAPGACQVLMTDTSSSPTQSVSNTLWWYGGQQQIETNQLTWSGENESILTSNRDGYLEIGSSHPVSVRAFQIEAGRTNEITPEPVHVVGFTVSPTNSIEYAIDHAGAESTLFRVDVRRFTTAADNSGAASGFVCYALLDGDGGTFKADKVALTNTFSTYDWLVTTNGLTNITVPQSLCFVLPPTVRALRIASPHGTLLVNAYSRPSHLAKKILVPEDYSPARRLAPEQPNWFTVLPPDHLQRRAALQCQLVCVQARPPEYDPPVQAGQYEWESFLPDSHLQGQMILIPPANGQPPRPDALSFSYFGIRVGEGQRVRFQGQQWEPQVAPSLMLVSTNGAPGSATVILDGQTLFDASLETPVTQVRLGNVTVGEHSIYVKTDSPVSAYLNYLESATNAAYLQRFCVMASTNTLHFSFVKREPEEVLVLRIFSPVETDTQPFQVHVRLNARTRRGVGPFSELTVMERDALVKPNPVNRTLLIAATTGQLDDGQPLFVPLVSDLPPGEYKLDVTVAARSPRWLSLSRTTPGLVETLEVASKRRLK